MTEDQAVEQYETVDEEVNTIHTCWWCSRPDMILRDPRQLPNGSVFSYCPECGGTYIVRTL